METAVETLFEKIIVQEHSIRGENCTWKNWIRSKICGANIFISRNIKYAWLMYWMKGIASHGFLHEQKKNASKWSVSKVLSSNCPNSVFSVTIKAAGNNILFDICFSIKRENLFIRFWNEIAWNCHSITWKPYCTIAVFDAMFSSVLNVRCVKWNVCCACVCLVQSIHRRCIVNTVY